MKDRLSKILASEGLTPSLLADKLGIQRSGISHIMSGRNYPSFDFLQKILVNFPKLSAEWLILGQGTMYKTTVTNLSDLFTSSEPVAPPPVSPTVSEKPKNLSSVEAGKKNSLDINPEILPPAEPKKTIEKIMVLYSDK
ncbi:MAG: helix-turn-helix domain-containing protein, partial [Firmicutes bacterium]|nr:helix-turn-helix domain-containing protein [Bacillota bacterium]